MYMVYNKYNRIKKEYVSIRFEVYHGGEETKYLISIIKYI
jgi:hypothetical protein